MYGPDKERLNDPSTSQKSGKEVTCPYDDSHQIAPERLHYHLKRCRQQHLDMNLAICPYQYTHHVPQESIQQHLKTCEYRYKGQRAFMVDDENKKPIQPIPDIECEENWDGPDSASYVPEEANKNKYLLISKKGLTKSERRKFRDDRRLINSAIIEKQNEDKKKRQSGFNSENQ